jgi:hypothetical protein
VLELRAYSPCAVVQFHSPTPIFENAPVAELVDALVLGTSVSAWEFESVQAHHKLVPRNARIKAGSAPPSFRWRIECQISTLMKRCEEEKQSSPGL